ncbi:MAG: hypothetical protein IPN81_12910 [Nitrosomonadales bacterium]|nr:hypothetical protein [Nitrosomonadales bacterium]
MDAKVLSRHFRQSGMEYHLAGRCIRDGCLVDTHSTQVCAECGVI